MAGRAGRQGGQGGQAEPRLTVRRKTDGWLNAGVRHKPLISRVVVLHATDVSEIVLVEGFGLRAGLWGRDAPVVRGPVERHADKRRQGRLKGSHRVRGALPGQAPWVFGRVRWAYKWRVRGPDLTILRARLTPTSLHLMDETSLDYCREPHPTDYAAVFRGKGFISYHGLTIVPWLQAAALRPALAPPESIEALRLSRRPPPSENPKPPIGDREGEEAKNRRDLGYTRTLTANQLATRLCQRFALVADWERVQPKFR
ncbi:uncharacterized protein BDZ99DRAFT_471899 [Mytilinidion resinicola]|uniref:Uncharacterized protein n=1 Tax=Mytilinidion resinicola TaxID=574789 RepID=A0A6A6Z6H2_9PEZI|nr:uncharacterized protein BDZ99DRAFT_471899 [Mytilinidion resinicola]KAF2816686.1 hypothetical protein BDZ99DRAFT_471899 [Mytilinidion resinicola]